MLTSAVRRSVIQVYFRSYRAPTINQNYNWRKFSYCCTQFILPRVELKKNLMLCRGYNTEPTLDSNKLLSVITDGDIFVSAPIFKIIKFFFTINLQVKLIVDKNFSLQDFAIGCKQALTTISNLLAKEDYESLDGLVSDNIMPSLRLKVNSLSNEQRRLMSFDVDDINFFTPYDVQVTNENNQGEKFAVKISVLFYYIPSIISEEMSNVNDVKNVIVGTYKFIRTYANNEGGPWIATDINQCSVISLLKTD